MTAVDLDDQPGPFEPLRERDYRYFFVGNVSSQVGTFCQAIAQSLLVYRLTRSTALVGVVNFAQFAAVPFLAPIAGVVADRVNRRTILIWVQLAALLFSGSMAALSAAGLATTWTVIALAGLLGTTSAFQFPVTRAYAPTLVSARNLGREVNLDSVAVALARALGPLLGALIVHRFGVTPAFVVNSSSFGVMLVALLRIPPREQLRRGGRPSILDGVRIVRRQPLLAGLLFIIAACAIGADPPVTLGPEFAHRFGGGDTTAGVILGAFGAGSVFGAFVAGSESPRHHRRVAGLLAVFVIGLVVFSLSAGLPMIVAGSFLAGFGFLTAQTRTSALLARSTADHERGRVMALWAIAFIGVRPFASLLDGFLGDYAGVRIAGLVMALPVAAACLVSLALHRRFRPADPDDPEPEAGGRDVVPAAS